MASAAAPRSDQAQAWREAFERHLPRVLALFEFPHAGALLPGAPFSLARRLPDQAAMPSTYYVEASRQAEVKIVRCSAAWVAIEQRDRLLRQGWKVVVQDVRGKPVSGEELVELMLAEGRA